MALEFTTKHGLNPQPLDVVIDGEHYDALALLPAGQTMELIGLTSLQNLVAESSPEKMREALTSILDFIESVLLPDSVERIKARVYGTHGAAPIDLNDLMGVVSGLVKHYTDRPTEPSAS